MSNEEKNQLLTPHERAMCQQIAMGDAPHSQRAAALLALDKGATQAQAGKDGGLSRGQVQYWLSKFRKQRLNIFPDDLLDEPLQPVSAKETEDEPKEEPAEVQPAEDVGKAKKAKGGRKKTVKKARKKKKKVKGKARPVKDVGKAKKGKGRKKEAGKKAKKKQKQAKKKAQRVKAAGKAQKAKGRKKEAVKEKSKKENGGKG